MSKWAKAKLKLLLRFYPPFIGAGIKVMRIADDWKNIKVAMKLRWYNKNAFGTHFGGSLYAMTDPFFALMLMNVMGSKYIVWDQAAQIKFIKPGKGVVKADFKLDDEMINLIKNKTDTGDKFLPEFTVDVIDQNGDIVAKVHKTLYIRRKRH